MIENHSESIYLRACLADDIPVVKTFFEQGRLYQRSLGFIQWLEGYPSRELLLSDIENGRAFVIETDGEIMGYVVIDLAGDPEYERLSHVWKHKGPYAVVHRFVLSDKFRGKGLATKIHDHIEEYVKRKGIHIIRFDTGLQNLPMQSVLNRLGYENLGDYEFVWGPRIAYEKKLN